MRRQAVVAAIAWYCVGMGVLCISRPAHAEILDDTTSLGAGHFSGAAEFQAGLMEGLSPLMVNLYENIGLFGGLDLWAREGFPVVEPRSYYFGGGIKWTILHDKPRGPGLALWVGGHYWTEEGWAGASVAMLVDHRFGRWTPYAGIHYELDFGNNGAVNLLRIILGVRIALATHVAWLVEGGLGLVGDPQDPHPFFISTGPRFSI